MFLYLHISPLPSTIYRNTKVIFPVNLNASLSEDVVILPDENNLFKCRVHGLQSYDSKSYWMPTNLDKLKVNFESDANEIYINGELYKKGSSYDFSEAVTVTASSDTGAEQNYTIKLDNFTGLPIIYPIPFASTRA